MSVNSGIGASPDLIDKFSAAINNKNTRFIKVSIDNECFVFTDSDIVEIASTNSGIRNTLQQDLDALQERIQDPVPKNDTPETIAKYLLKNDRPAYLLARLDDPPSEWLFIAYVPDTAHVRDKMLYSSSQASLLKGLGSSLFSDSMSANSKNDLTPQGYADHRRHVLAPPPLSAREREMADVLAAERAGNVDAYQGSRARDSPIGNTLGMPWAPELEQAVKDLGEGDDSALVVATIDMASETLRLRPDSRETSTDIPAADILAADVGTSLPPDDASYAFFAWKHAPSRRDIVSIYSCPSGTHPKHRMVYASGFNAVFTAAQTLLKDSSTQLLKRKIQTSSPAEIDEAFLRSELDLSSGGEAPQARTSTLTADAGKPFARPQRPKKR
ncbi:actin depolymerizing protein [Mycena polygramma]|nr:actin depolymerizing protein [Mycena polygramma]